MKVDKEFLLTHRFWIMLFTSAPIALAGLFILLGPVSSHIHADNQKLKGKLATLQKGLDPVSPPTLEAMEELLKKLQAKQAVLWAAAYKEQDDLFRWAPQVEQQFDFHDRLFLNQIDAQKLASPPPNPKDWPADRDGELMHGTLLNHVGDWITISNRKGETVKFQKTANYRFYGEDKGKLDFAKVDTLKGSSLLAIQYQRGHYFNDPLTNDEQAAFTKSYRNQIYPILDQIQPVSKDGGVVQLRDWSFDTSKDNLPPNLTFLRYVRDAWKQDADISEEAWIAQEEIWLQNEIYRCIRAANDSVSKLEGTGGSKAGKYTFQNPYLSLEVTWPPKGDQLDVTIFNKLNRRQKLDQRFVFRIGKNTYTEPINLPGEPLEPKGVEKDSRSVKLSLDKGTPRNEILGVEQQLTWETAAVKRIDLVSMGEDIAESHRSFATPLRTYGDDLPALEPVEVKKGPNAPPPGPRVDRFAGGKMTINGLRRDRYIEVTPQARRIPVAVSLIVEQDHIDRVLTAFNNSRLRFLTTQVILNHYPQSLRPKLQTAGAVPGPRVGPALKEEAATGQDLEANIEMVIYGIMTLYERYPPRQPLAAVADGKQ